MFRELITNAPPTLADIKNRDQYFLPVQVEKRHKLLARARMADADEILMKWQPKTSYERKKPSKGKTKERVTDFIGVTMNFNGKWQVRHAAQGHQKGLATVDHA